MAIDRQQMREIHQAIMKYRRDHHSLPDWLSDLVPDYLPDAERLISPRERRTGVSRLWGYEDPKLKTSYVYEFSANRAGATVNRDREEPISMRDWKSLQMEEFGPAIPLLRCHLYDKVLNLSYSGDTYQTELFWENDPATLALVEKRGPGNGSPDAKHLTLTVQTEKGEPIPHVLVTASERESEYFHLPPIRFTTNSDGVCRVRLGRGEIKSVAISFRADGYAAPPIRFEGGDGVHVPEAHTIQMTPAVTIGGVVAGREGQLLSQAKVTINGTTQDAAGQFVEFEYDSVTSDSNGKWKCSRVAKGFESLSFMIQHPDFRPAEYFQIEEDEAGEEEIARQDLVNREARFTLEPGIEVQGKIRTPTGQPVIGARVTLRSNDDPPVTQTGSTDLSGSYRFVVMEETQFNLVVETPDHAPAHRIIEADEALEAQHFDLKAGTSITGEVVTTAGSPIEGAQARVLSWNDLHLIQWTAPTDANGMFSWPHAPGGKITLEVSKAGYTPSHLTLGDDRSPKIILSETFLFTGTVVDADTGEPIPDFNVVKGRTHGVGGEENVRWEFHDSKRFTNGRLAIEESQARPGPHGRFKYLVSANGYLPESSPAIEQTGWHEHHFRLKPGKGPHGTILSPEGNALEGAEIVLLGASYVTLGSKELVHRGPVNPFQTQTDQDGRFELPAAVNSFHIAAIHESGYREHKDFDPNDPIELQLQPWGHVEGTLYAGTKPWADQEIMISNHEAYHHSGLSLDFRVFKTRTDEAGQFTIPNVPPGVRKLVVLIEIGDGQNKSWQHSHMERINVLAGEPTKVVHGKKGRPITGRFKLSNPSVEVDWNNGHRTLGTKQLMPPPGLSPGEHQQWSQTPEVIESRRNYRYYSFQISEDGSFRIENIPPGEYTFRLHLNDPEGDRFTSRPIAIHRQDLEIPPFEGTVSDEPHDIGEITIQINDRR